MTKNLPTVDIKGKDYVLVKDRLLYFNEEHPNGSIVTELVSATDAQQIIIRATITPDIENPDRKFTGYSQAVVGDGYINKTSALENAETSAVGRALAFMGIGVLESVASADELRKAQITERLARNASRGIPSSIVDYQEATLDEDGNPINGNIVKINEAKKAYNRSTYKQRVQNK